MEGFPDFPETIGNWVRGEGRRYPPPMGISMPYYLEDGTTASIYFYDGGYERILPGPDSPQVRDQFEQSKSDIYAAQDQGVWSNVRHLGDDTITLGLGSQAVQALCTTFALIDSDGNSGFSQILLTAAGNLFVKVRLSFREARDEDWQSSVALLLAWLGQLIEASDRSEAVVDLQLPFASVHYVRFEFEQLLDHPRTIINSIGMKLVPIPPGEFLMGGRAGEDGYDPEEEWLHKVRITRPFLMGMFQVTQGEYAAVMRHNPSVFHGKTRPVEHVSWKDAVEFCHQLSQFPSEKHAGREYRLPTEAEWEYACRAGTDTAYSFGQGLTRFEANFCDEWVAGPQPTYPVGMFPPNSFGLFDMHGNVWEWCADWYSIHH